MVGVMLVRLKMHRNGKWRTWNRHRVAKQYHKHANFVRSELIIYGTIYQNLVSFTSSSDLLRIHVSPNTWFEPYMIEYSNAFCAKQNQNVQYFVTSQLFFIIVSFLLFHTVTPSHVKVCQIKNRNEHSSFSSIFLCVLQNKLPTSCYFDHQKSTDWIWKVSHKPARTRRP